MQISPPCRNSSHGEARSLDSDQIAERTMDRLSASCRAVETKPRAVELQQRQANVRDLFGLKQRWLTLGLIVVIPILAWTSSLRKSPTFDEPYHVAIGYANWIEGVQRWDHAHPPLGRLWAAFPLLFLDLDLPSKVTNQGELAHQFTFQNRISSNDIIQTSRLMACLPAILLATGVFMWSRQLFGNRAGMLSLLCISLDPNVLAHSALITNDLIVTTALFLTMYSFWKLDREPTVRLAFITGLLMGIALTAKYSSLILIPILVASAVGRIWDSKRRRFRQLVWVALVVAAIVVFLVSGLEVISVREFAREQQFSQSTAPESEWPVWTEARLPLVRYVFGAWKLLDYVSTERRVFLCGKILPTGTPLFFPLAFLVKTPVPVLILCTWMSIAALRADRKPANRDKAFPLRDWYHLGIAPALYAIAALAGGLNLGYRHLLPALPFLYVALGWLAKSTQTRQARLVVGALVAWLALESLVTYPHYLAYFNTAAGGPSSGYNYLVDSSLDWGQELINLAQYQSSHKIERFHLGYFGSADPAVYGIEYDCLPSFGLLHCPDAELPTEGWIAVSATCLQGLCSQDSGFYSSLRAAKPAAVLGHSMFIYHLP